MNRDEKKQIIDELKDKFQRAKALVLTDYKGLTVAEITEFRDKLRESKIEYRVVKNTLARIATEETPASALGQHFKGPVGLAIGYDDPALVAKAVLEYSKKNDKLSMTSGMVEGAVLSVEQLKTVAELPPKEVLLSQIAGCFQAPAAKLARLLSATVTQLGYALSALRDKKAGE